MVVIASMMVLVVRINLWLIHVCISSEYFTDVNLHWLALTIIDSVPWETNSQSNCKQRENLVLMNIVLHFFVRFNVSSCLDKGNHFSIVWTGITSFVQLTLPSAFRWRNFVFIWMGMPFRRTQEAQYHRQKHKAKK